MAQLCVNNFVWEGDVLDTGWFKGYHQNREAWLSPKEKYMIVRGLDGFWVYEAQTGRVLDLCDTMKEASTTVRIHAQNTDPDRAFPSPINKQPFYVGIPIGSDPEWKRFKRKKG